MEPPRIIKATSNFAFKHHIRIYDKNGDRIDFRCKRVRTDGTYADCYVMDEDGHIAKDENNDILCERIWDVKVISIPMHPGEVYNDRSSRDS